MVQIEKEKFHNDFNNHPSNMVFISRDWNFKTLFALSSEQWIMPKRYSSRQSKNSTNSRRS